MIGAGAWGTGLGQVSTRRGNKVILHAREG